MLSVYLAMTLLGLALTSPTFGADRPELGLRCSGPSSRGSRSSAGFPSGTMSPSRPGSSWLLRPCRFGTAVPLPNVRCSRQGACGSRFALAIIGCPAAERWR